MSILVIITTGTTDVQLVQNASRYEFDGRKLADLHTQIETRNSDWALIDSPIDKSRDRAENIPEGNFNLCTPKLDAVFDDTPKDMLHSTHWLILETQRDADKAKGDPRYAGAIFERRLQDKGVLASQIHREAYLSGDERLEDDREPRDSIIRRDVVKKINDAIQKMISGTKPQKLIVAATGGMASVTNLVEEVARLHGNESEIDFLEVADGFKAKPPTADRAVSRKKIPEPSESYRSRWHALNLVKNGNLRGAWGAVAHLHGDDVEKRWTQVVEWLANFASSLPLPKECDIEVLSNKLRAVRAALRVELALRSGDIPRAVHGTVAFFESALWDHLDSHAKKHDDPKKPRLYTLNPTPLADQIRNSKDDRDKPFLQETIDGQHWYRIFDDNVAAVRIAKHYLNKDALKTLGQAIGEDVRMLRNDVAHNEPTQDLMMDAKQKMQKAQLWSNDDRFLTMSFIQNTLLELGVAQPAELLTNLIEEVRRRLLNPE